MAATTIEEEDDLIVIECRDPHLIQRSSDNLTPTEIFISTADISSWDLPFILTHRIVKVNIKRSRLIEQSSYFQSLLSGNFSESSLCCVSIQWSLETFLHILRFIHGCHMEVTTCNFLPLCHASLYFGLESLVLECRNWFSNIITKNENFSDLKLGDLIHFWDFGFEHAIDWISALCIGYVAKNFMWALSCDSFVALPFEFLVSCVKHPHLTVDSERHLCEALLAWVCANMELLQYTCSVKDDSNDKSKQLIFGTHGWNSIFDEIRVNLLPLWFIMGSSRCCYFSTIAKHGLSTIVNRLKEFSKNLNIVDACDQSCMRIRLTEFSKKLDLSGCPQISSSDILYSVLHQKTSVGPFFLEGVGRKSNDLQCPKWLSSLATVSCEAMMEVDISKCSFLHLGVALECFRKSFPFLRTVRMAYFLDFETRRLCQLFENNPSVCEVDLTVDVSPLISSNISVLYSGSVSRPALKKYFDMSSCYGRRATASNITKLTLEGRSDFSDPELLHIAECCISLHYLNIRGCSSVTDVGIANLILKCTKLHSLIASDTSFGRNSTSALCSRVLDGECSQMEIYKNPLELSDIYFEVLHIGGCKGVSETSIGDILSRGRMFKNLCLRNTLLVDHVLYSFPGSSLEILDVSNTMISRDALLYMLSKNPGLKYFNARGCKKLCADKIEYEEELLSSDPCDKLFCLLGRECKLEELVIGWGFSFFSLKSMGPALKSLKAINVGLGGSLGPEGLTLLCTLSPLLESITILFQVICDSLISNLLGTLRNLQALSICYCIGDVSSLSLKHSVPNITKLKLERVTPWLTNEDLALLTKNFANLIELSLVGCTNLGEDSQQIISSGWPGLISLHLEDCGAVTMKGTEFLFNCLAMEDLLLHHNGPGIKRNFILDAASRLPMLRSISLDWCDAIEGDFDLPDFADKYSLSNVKISRCKLQKCTLDFQCVEAQKRPVHNETLALVWNSTSLQRTVVKERIT